MDGTGVRVLLQATGYVVNYLTLFSILNSVPIGPNNSQDLFYMSLKKGSRKFIVLVYKCSLCVPIMCQALFLSGMLVFLR